MEQDHEPKKAPMIGFMAWLIAILVVLAVAAIVGPRMWQGATYSGQQILPQGASAPAPAASR